MEEFDWQEEFEKMLLHDLENGNAGQCPVCGGRLIVVNFVDSSGIPCQGEIGKLRCFEGDYLGTGEPCESSFSLPNEQYAKFCEDRRLAK